MCGTSRRFCPFAMIIENPDERLFECQRDDCQVVSCRECKKVRRPSSASSLAQ